MAVSNRWVALRARQLGLDPRAVFAIGYHESGNRDTAVGDNGTSFGRFQLHEGGALPTGRGAAWAGSQQGVNYALTRMAGVARGLRGQAAVAAISHGFERPANPAAEIADAMRFYNGGAQVAPGSATPTQPREAPQPGNRQALLSLLMQQNQSYATTGKVDPSITSQMLSMASGSMPSRGAFGAALPGATGGPQSPVAAKAIQIAKSAVGTPYVWGGEGKGGFDCSGLIQWAYAHAGVKIPRVTYDQAKVGQPVQWGNFRPGDLIFSDFEGTGQPTHVVMYVGNGQVVAAPHTGTAVQIQNINLFRNHFVGARRIL